MRDVTARPRVAELTVGRPPVLTASGVADRLGAFDEEFARDGVAVSIVTSPEPPNVETLVAESGSLDALRLRATGAETRLVALGWVDAGGTLVGRRTSAHRSPSALRSQRFGLSIGRDDPDGRRRAAALRAYSSALAIAGCGLGDVHLVPIERPELDALRDGEVDVVYLPHRLTHDVARDYDVRVAIDLDTYSDPRVRINDVGPLLITACREVLEEAPDLVARFLAVLLDTSQWAAGHRRELARVVRSADGRQFPPDLHLGAHRRLGIDLTRDRFQLLAQQHRFLRTHGFLERDVDLIDWIDPAPLHAAADLLAARRIVGTGTDGASPVPSRRRAGFGSPT